MGKYDVVYAGDIIYSSPRDGETPNPRGLHVARRNDSSPGRAFGERNNVTPRNMWMPRGVDESLIMTGGLGCDSKGHQ
jgi:hypothetical protein